MSTFVTYLNFRDKFHKKHKAEAFLLLGKPHIGVKLYPLGKEYKCVIRIVTRQEH